MNFMEKTAEIIIIGGGIIGTSLAYHLGQKGAKGVVLLERGMLGEGATAKCVGGIRFQFSTEINILFSLESAKTWQHFEELTEVDLGFKKVGYLFLATTPEEWEIFQANAKLQKSYGIPVELLPPQEIRYRWPYLRVDDLQGGTFCPWEGYAGPYEALTGYAKGARKKGIRIYENTEVQQISCRKWESDWGGDPQRKYFRAHRHQRRGSLRRRSGEDGRGRNSGQTLSAADIFYRRLPLDSRPDPSNH